MPTNISGKSLQLSRDIQLPSDRDVDVAGFLNTYLSSESPAKDELPFVLDALRQRSSTLQNEISHLIQEEQKTRCRTKEDVWKGEEVKESMEKMLKDMRKLQVEAREAESTLGTVLKDARRIERARINVRETKEALSLFAEIEEKTEQAERAVKNKDLGSFSRHDGLIWSLIVNGNRRLDELEKGVAIGIGLQKKRELKKREVILREDLRVLVISRYDLLADRVADAVVRQTLAETMKPNILAAIERLKESCAVASALGPEIQAELIGVHIKARLRAWRESFRGIDVFASVGKRYTWLKRELTTSWAHLGNEREDRGWALIFPSMWSIPWRLADAVLRATKSDIEQELSRTEIRVNVNDVVNALQLSRNFEWELDKRFKVISESRDTSSPPIVSMESLSEPLSEPSVQVSFEGLVSSCFEPHLDVYVQALDTEIAQTLSLVLREETWHLPKEGSILSSASTLFLTLKRILSALSQLSTSQPLFSLHRCFGKHLEFYSEALLDRLRSTSYDFDEKTLEGNMLSACAIARTADYCASTTDGLKSAFVSAIDSAFANDVNFSRQVSSFKTVASRSIGALATMIDTFLDQYIKPVGSIPWAASLKATGDTTSYVSIILSKLQGKLKIVEPRLSIPQQRVLLQKIMSDLMRGYLAAVLSIPLLNPIAAQQLLLDVAAFKSGLTDMVKIGQSAGSQTVKNNLNSHILRIEGILKAVLAPQETTKDVYERQIPNGSRKELARICEMKGINEAESSKVVLAFTSNSRTDSARAERVRPDYRKQVQQPPIPRSKSQITAQIEKTSTEAVEAVTGSMKRLWGKWGESLTGGVGNAAETMRREAVARGFRFGS